MRNPVRMFADMMVRKYEAKFWELSRRYAKWDGYADGGQSVRMSNAMLMRNAWANRGGAF